MSEIRATGWIAKPRLVKDRYEYINEMEKDDWKLKVFCVEQEDIENFDKEKELKLVEACHKKILEVFSNPNKYERRIARMEKIPIDEPATKKLHSGIVFTSHNEYYCWGSGGVGGGKTFWTPYTVEDERLRNKIIRDDVCDNCRTAAHELQHGIGGHAEFDNFSDLISLYFRLENFGKGERLEHYIEDIVRSTIRGLKEGWKGGLKRERRNMFCAMNERYPDTLRKIVEEDEYLAELMEREGYDYDKLVKEACK